MSVHSLIKCFIRPGRASYENHPMEVSLSDIKCSTITTGIATMTKTRAGGPFGPSRPLSSRDLQHESSDSRMEIIGANSSRMLCPMV